MVDRRKLQEFSVNEKAVQQRRTTTTSRTVYQIDLERFLVRQTIAEYTLQITDISRLLLYCRRVPYSTQRRRFCETSPLFAAFENVQFSTSDTAAVYYII